VFNLGAQLRTFKLLPAMFGGSAPTKLRDAWRQRDLGSFSDGIKVSAPAHGVALFVVH
jgi:hypothetical protein